MSIHKTNTGTKFIYNERIEEWDIKSANTSLMRMYRLIPASQIAKIESFPKERRVETVGLMIRKNPAFGKALEKAFDDIIHLFLEANQLDPDMDIVSIKKDAVFVRSKRITVSSFGDQYQSLSGDMKYPVNFIRKNVFTGFLYLPRYEVYYHPDQIIVKGISNEALPLHQTGMLYLFRALFQLSHDWRALNEFLKEYAGAYKRRELDYDAYREFTSESAFRVMLFGNETMMETIDDEMLSLTDISYNYIHIYLEILRIVVR